MPTKKTTEKKSAVKATPVVEIASKPRVQRAKTVKHSKAAVAVVELSASSAHDQIARIAYGYWEARGFQAGSPEQDWLRAEQEFLLGAKRLDLYLIFAQYRQ